MMEVQILSKRSPLNTNEKDLSLRDNEVSNDSKEMMELGIKKVSSSSGGGTVLCQTQQSVSVVKNMSPFNAAEKKPNVKEKTLPTAVELCGSTSSLRS